MQAAAERMFIAIAYISRTSRAALFIVELSHITIDTQHINVS